MDLVVRANWDKVKEEKEMCEALKELFADELQESLAAAGMNAKTES